MAPTGPYTECFVSISAGGGEFWMGSLVRGERSLSLFCLTWSDSPSPPQTSASNQVIVLWTFINYPFFVALTLSKFNFDIGNFLGGIHFEGYVLNNKTRPNESHLLLLNSGGLSTLSNQAINMAPAPPLRNTLTEHCNMSTDATCLDSLISFWLLLSL